MGSSSFFFFPSRPRLSSFLPVSISLVDAIKHSGVVYCAGVDHEAVDDNDNVFLTLFYFLSRRACIAMPGS